jgi:hypothetical protein
MTNDDLSIEDCDFPQQRQSTKGQMVAGKLE